MEIAEASAKWSYQAGQFRQIEIDGRMAEREGYSPMGKGWRSAMERKYTDAINFDLGNIVECRALVVNKAFVELRRDGKVILELLNNN